jgi:HEAT repeat protein
MFLFVSLKSSYIFGGNIFLLNIIQEFLSKLINVNTLSFAIKIMLVIIIILIIAIYALLYDKKKKHFKLLLIRTKLEPLISQFIIDESSATAEQLEELSKIIDTSLARQYMVDELIRSKQNHSGEVADRIVTIYIGLDLKKYSIEKIQPKNNWYTIARGIQELYMMEQQDAYDDIYTFTNASNEYLRNEAQIGLIHLTGFMGLDFLEMVLYPITDWQQLKLLEQLKRFPKKEDFSASIPKWLRSENNSVVVFALKLCYEYQQIQLTDEITNCLKHESSRVRTETIETLVRLENDQTPKTLLGYFDQASRSDKLLILDAMSHLATEDDAPELIKILEYPDNLIKLKASIALSKCSSSGMQLIAERSLSEPEPFHRIVNHILATT